MVKLCYIIPLVCLCVSPTLALSTEHVKHINRQVVLSKPNQKYIKKTYSFVEPHLQKRNPSYRAVKTRISSITKKSDNIVEDEEFEDDEAAANSYSFRSLQKKLGLGGKTFERPVNEPVPNWDDQYYANDGKPVVKQVDTEELKELMHTYLEMGKEKWAAFLATSECNKFQKLMNKLHYLFKRNESNDEGGENDENEDEDYKAHKPFSLDDDDHEEEDTDNVKSSHNKIKVSSAANQLNLNSHKGSKNVNRQPLFSSIPEEEVEEFHNLLLEVVSYWEKEDARSILEAASGLSYKDFDLSDEDEKPKKKNSTKHIETSFSVIDDNDDEDDYEEGRDDDDQNSNTNVNDNDNIDDGDGDGDDDDDENDDDDDDDDDETKKHDSNGPDLLGKLDLKLLKTKAQKDWLKSNALRRAKMIQKLMDGELDEENYLKQDEVRYRDNNIFLEEDENEIPNTAFRLQSTNLAMYAFFLVEALLFYVF